MYISIKYFPFYDDEYGHVHYDDDGDHAEHDTQGSANLRTSLQTASSTMMGPVGVRIAWGFTLARVGRV